MILIYMKNIFLYHLLLLTAVVVLTTSCKKWIDVSPKTDVKSKDLFETEDGFKSALIGVYGRMTNDETYGKNLTFGFVEELVHRYDNYSSNVIPSDEERAAIYDYAQYAYSKGMINSIWSEMYKNIANVNNLIYNINMQGDRILISPYYRTMIEGEAYALRAFHYFDLLRLWGPIYSQNSSTLALPWRTELSSDKSPLLPANEIVQNILNDLKRAEELLKDDEMILDRHPSDLFLGQRRFRMNLYAVKALMARVYLYAGDHVNAAKYAKDVIDNSGMNLVNNTSEDVAMSKESLFCLSMHDMENRLVGDWKSTTNMNNERWITSNNIRTVFEFYSIGVNDIRYRNGYGFIHGMNRFMSRKYLGTGNVYANIIPVIRLSEMYLIMAEAEGSNDGYTYLNTLRNVRGISRNNNIGSGVNDADYLEYLNKEYQKEYFAEGQWFYFLKRHEVDSFYRSPVEKMNYYVLPIPDDEIEFGDVNL